MRDLAVNLRRVMAVAGLAGAALLSGAVEPVPPANFREQVQHDQPGFLTSLPAWNESLKREADAALTGTFTLQDVTGTVPRGPDGGWDWRWRGPHDDPEFAWFLNRHHQIPALFVAWRETHEARYRQALNEQLRDWLRQNPRPAGYSFSPAWRALEVARRAEEAWLPVLFSPEAEAALDSDVVRGMLASIAEHAAALHEAHSFAGNHLITEMSALAAIALAFPEFKDAPQWLEYALATVQHELQRQFYPDGAQMELSNLYQQVVLTELQHLADMLAAAGRAQELAVLRPAIENAWNYYAYTLSPLGHGPLNNDSSRGDDAGQVRQVAGRYQRPDWLFVATGGREGTAPPGLPSGYFPWAGLAVMRGGWSVNDAWAFFDMGPNGSDHQHADRLHLTVGGRREFLVDDGRYNYQPGVWRDYFTGPRGHNVVLLDGRGTLPPPNTARGPAVVRHEITHGQDFFEATAPFAGDVLHGQGPAYHTRDVLYFRNGYWIVADRVFCAGPHTIETLWHFHPACTVKHEGRLVYTADPGQANLGLLALQTPPDGWQVELVRGREGPSPQGWYSQTFNERVPATCASFSATVRAPCTTVWLIWIVPAGQDVKAAQPRGDEAWFYLNFRI